MTRIPSFFRPDPLTELRLNLPVDTPDLSSEVIHTDRIRIGRPRPINLNNLQNTGIPQIPAPRDITDRTFEWISPHTDHFTTIPSQQAGGSVLERIHDASSTALAPSQPSIITPHAHQTPSLQINQRLDDAAKNVLENNSSPADGLNPLGVAATALKSVPKHALFFIPFLIHRFYSSKDKIFISTDITIEATKKVNNVTFSLSMKDKPTLTQTFRIQAGKPVEPVNENKFSSYTTDQAPSYFNTPSFLSNSEGVPYFPVIEKLIDAHTFKKQVFYTQLNIIINDPGNPELQNGPQTITLPFSECEQFNIINRDPHSIEVSLQGDLTDGEFTDPSNTEFTIFQNAQITLAEPCTTLNAHKTQTFPLQFKDGFDNLLGMELKVTQQIL